MNRLESKKMTINIYQNGSRSVTKTASAQLLGSDRKMQVFFNKVNRILMQNNSRISQNTELKIAALKSSAVALYSLPKSAPRARRSK